MQVQLPVTAHHACTTRYSPLTTRHSPLATRRPLTWCHAAHLLCYQLWPLEPGRCRLLVRVVFEVSKLPVPLKWILGFAFTKQPTWLTHVSVQTPPNQAEWRGDAQYKPRC
jgi:hypothetical protein